MSKSKSKFEIMFILIEKYFKSMFFFKFAQLGSLNENAHVLEIELETGPFHIKVFKNNISTTFEKLSIFFN
jgi:hypothetical protein